MRIQTMCQIVAIAAACSIPGVACKSTVSQPPPRPAPHPEPASPPDTDPEPEERAPHPMVELPPHEDGIVQEKLAQPADEGKVDAQALQQEALELCQSAAEFIDQGLVEDAIAALDRAYELMLELPNNGDTTFLQAKEDIRVMVADLVTRTYESQRTAARMPGISWDLAIRLVENDHVEREIRSFTGPEREAFLEGYRRSGRYRPMILRKLEEAGLPSQLSWMPLVESWFKTRAYSRASALGMWQFIHSTGLRYGLSRDGWVDERMDPEKSTDAAIAYLIELHELFGDWPKALAAYNCGEARVMRLTNRSPEQYQDFWDLYALLPGETRRYVPRFIASLMIIENPEAYGMTLPEPDQPMEDWSRVVVEKSMQLERLDRELGLPTGTLKSLNPELRHAATPGRPYELRVPSERETVLVAALPDIPEWSPPRPASVTHRVRRGDTLSGIARRYGTSVGAIMQANRLRSAHRIWPGQRLEVPVRGSVSTGTYNPAKGTHTVRRGESLYSIARRYGTGVAELKRINGLSSNLIHPGQTLNVNAGSASGGEQYRVRRGDTLSQIADAHSVSLGILLRANGLSSRSTIYPGQTLVIPN